MLKAPALAIVLALACGAAPAARAQATVPLPSPSPAAPPSSASPSPADAPLPSPSPADAPATAADGPAGGVAATTDGPADGATAPAALVDPATVPLPEERPEPPAEEPAAPGAPGEAPAPAAAPVPETAPPPAPPAEGAAPAAGPAAPAAGATAPPAAEPPPQPAYVPPDEARTTPEPEAPSTPPMEVTPAETVEAAAAVEDAVLCEGELRERGAKFSVGETIADGDCGVLRPVAIEALSSGVTVAPDTVMLCRTALALDVWVAESVVPAAKAEFSGAAVRALEQSSTYVCRARASESRISEHSRGSAIDIAAVTTDGGRTIRSEAQAPGSAEDRFAAAIRRGACGPFKTVLGPGTDSDHGDHLHLDIAARANGSLYCR